MLRDSGRECESSCSGSPAGSPYLSSSSSSSSSCSPALPHGVQDFSPPFVPTLTAVTSSPDLRWMVQPSVITSAARPPGPPVGYAYHHHHQQQQQQQQRQHQQHLQRLGGPAAPTQRILQGPLSRPGVIRIVASAPARRKRPAEELNPEEDEKRRVRRERNKQAAAKCRYRRRELTDSLQAEADKLEEERAGLQADICRLQKEREHLEGILSAHRALCQLPPSPEEPDGPPVLAGEPQQEEEEERRRRGRQRGVDIPRGPAATLVSVKLEPAELVEEEEAAAARDRAPCLLSPERPGGESHSCATSYRHGGAGGGQGGLRSAGRGGEAGATAAAAASGALGSRTLLAL